MKILKISILSAFLVVGGFSVALAADPTVSSIAPTTAHEGEDATLMGANFDASTMVKLEDPHGRYQLIKPKTYATTQLTFSLPYGLMPGTHLLWAYIGNTSLPTLNNPHISLDVLDTVATITSVNPTTARVGETVTITGTNFDANTVVQFFGKDGSVGFVDGGTPLPGNTLTSYAFTVPPGIKGVSTIRVRNMYSDLVSNTITLNVLPISPVIEYVGSGVAYQVPQNTARPEVTELFLHGKNIDSDSVVVIDNQINVNWVYCTKNFTNDTCFYVPKNVSAGSHSMYIRQKDSGLTSNTVSLTVTDKPIISYTSKYLTVGAAIQACGIGFDSKSVAVFDGVTEGALMDGAAPVCANFRIPATLSVGSHTIQIKQTDTGGLSNSLPITVAAGTSAPSVPPSITPATITPITPVPTTPTPSPMVTTPTSIPAQSNNNAVLQRQLVQLITTLLQLVQQAAAQGLLTSSQVLTILNSIPAIH